MPKCSPEERAVLAALAAFSDEELAVITSVVGGRIRTARMTTFHQAEVARRAAAARPCLLCEQRFHPVGKEKMCSESCRQESIRASKHAARERKKKEQANGASPVKRARLLVRS